MTNIILVGLSNKFWLTLARMTSDEDATPALLMAKPTWLITQLSAQAHRLLASHLATVGARGYHFRLLAALAESGPASQASLGRRTEIDHDVTAAVGELAADGLVERTSTPTTVGVTSSRSLTRGGHGCGGSTRC